MLRFKGYIYSREFLGERVPQNVQNLVIKNYLEKNKINFLFSSTEYSHKGSYHILFSLLKELNKIDGIVFYSIFQLPENQKLRKEIIKVFLKKKKQIHFALEELSLKNEKDFFEIEKLFKLKLAFNEKKFKIGKLQNFVSFRHNKVNRNYIERMNMSKIKNMKVSKRYGKDYWDGDRKFGYGGFVYMPGYLDHLVKKLIQEYNLKPNSKIIDIGCGKGYLVYELTNVLKNRNIIGIDNSKYALKNSKKEIRNKLFLKDIRKHLTYDDNEFDLAICINTLHNLKLPYLYETLKEINRIAKNKFICMESYRNEKELFNLECWALTAETIIDTSSWKWLFEKSGYTGDYEFIYFK